MRFSLAVMWRDRITNENIRGTSHRQHIKCSGGKARKARQMEILYIGYVGRTVRMELADSRSRGVCETGYMDIKRT